MPPIIHFLSLIFEYNLLPLSLFLAVFFSKKMSEKRDLNEPFKTNGFEFVLIEAFANFSLCLRIFSDSKIPYSYLYIVIGAVCFILFLWLILLFAFGIFINKSIHTEKIEVFTNTFYSTFISWCIRVMIISYFAELIEFTIEICLIQICSLIIVIACFSYFVEGYFLDWNIKLLEMNAYLKTYNYSRAIQIGSKIMKRTQGKEGDKNMNPYNLALAGTAFAYFLQGKTGVKEFDEIIKKVSNYIDEPMSKQFQKQRHKLMLIALNYKKGEKKSALEYVDKYLEKNNKIRYTDAIEKGTLEMFFNT